MKRIGKIFFTFLISIGILLINGDVSYANELDISAISSIVIEVSTGNVIYEDNADEIRAPASITKIMTLILIFEQLESGRISLDDPVVTSAYAKSMGGSQVFLEEGEIQTVDTLIKCIAVSSGNDASVAMAEYIGGSETNFVTMMNEKVVELGLVHTHFEDCCGLSDSDNHYTTARDVAAMSRELVTKYPQMYEYSSIWMEDIVHETSTGNSVFTLSSTNKLLKSYPYATGLKTGSTSKALYCLSATATKEDIDLIAVVMAAPTSTNRQEDATKLLEYGFAVCDLYVDTHEDALSSISVVGGMEDWVEIEYENEFRYLDTGGNNLDQVESELILLEQVEAPVDEGQKLGEISYQLNGTNIGSVAIVASKEVAKAVYKDYFIKIWKRFLL